MFDNTIELSLNGGSLTLTRVNQDKFTSLYRHRSTEWLVDAAIRHTTRTDSVTKIQYDRHNVELNWTHYYTIAGVAHVAKFKTYYVFEVPSDTDTGSTVAIMNALKDTFITNDRVTRLTNWES